LDTTFRRRALPLVGALGTGSRATCTYQCGDACHLPVPNRSDNETFADVVATSLSRRGFLKAGLSAAVVVGTAGGVTALVPTQAQAAPAGLGFGADAARLTFQPILPTTVDDVVVPVGYDYEIIIKWGDPVLPNAPDFDFENQTPQAQAGQFGYNCDYVAFFPLRGGEPYAEEPSVNGGRGRNSRHGLLVVNHEYTNPELMFRDYRLPVNPEDPASPMAPPTREQVDIQMHAHGISVIEIRRRGRKVASPEGRLAMRKPPGV